MPLLLGWDNQELIKPGTQQMIDICWTASSRSLIFIFDHHLFLIQKRWRITFVPVGTQLASLEFACAHLIIIKFIQFVTKQEQEISIVCHYNIKFMYYQFIIYFFFPILRLIKFKESNITILNNMYIIPSIVDDIYQQI